MAGGSPNVDKNGKKGPQTAHQPDVEPYVAGTKVSNFSESSPGAAKNMRGLTNIDPRNVRGSSNYK